MNGHKYTVEEIEYLAANVAGRTFHELQALFNQRFGLCLSEPQISAACSNRNMHNGLRGGQFTPGHTSANKDIKGTHFSPETEFKKGNLPANHRTVGSENLRKNDYVWVKIGEPKYWRQKHVVVWEGLHGPRPPKHAVIFADGNRLNFEPNNLFLISRKELSVMNKFRLIGGSRELTEAGRIVADIKMKSKGLCK